jgi:hypothetical protein
MSAKKYHATPTGQIRECKATKRACRYGPALHGNTKDEVKQIIINDLESKHGAFAEIYRPRKNAMTKHPTKKGNVVRRGVEMSKIDAALKDNLIRSANEIISRRAHSGDILLAKANPSAAERRLKKAVDFADQQNNGHLMKTLQNSKVLPSSRFKSSDGTVVDTDTYLDRDEQMSRVDDERKRLDKVVKYFVSSSNLKKPRYELDGEIAKVVINVKENQLDEDYLKTLPESLKRKIQTRKPKVSLDLVRLHLDKETQDKILTNSQTTNVVLGSRHDVGKYVVNADTSLPGKTDEDKMDAALNNYQQLYADAQISFGMKYRDLKKTTGSMNNVMKTAAKLNNPDGNTYIPARALNRGVVINNRQQVNQTEARKNLTPEQLALVSNYEYKVDEDLARQHLSEEQFGKLFGARTASVRVTEK